MDFLLFSLISYIRRQTLDTFKFKVKHRNDSYECIHSKKHPGQLRYSEKVHWGQTPFRVKDDPEIGQLSADWTNNGVRLTNLWVTFRVKLTDFRVIVDPEWSLAPMDPFLRHADPGVFRVCISVI